MAFIMGVMTVIRVSRAVPRRLTDASLYYSDIHHANPMFKGQNFGPTPLSASECFAIIKHMAKLEAKVNMLSLKQAAMSAEKEEMLNAAVSRISALEEELAATKNVTPCKSLRVHASLPFFHHFHDQLMNYLPFHFCETKDFLSLERGKNISLCSI